ncbi:alpha/beta hydrolase [Kribbella sandramycini]|nr:alpha/beta hydrolase [Kribbella sandramycini]
MYAADAAEHRGAHIHRIWWADPDIPLTLTEPERGPWVCHQVERALEAASGEVLVIGRSLGGYASSVVAEWGVAGVWLSPILTSEWVVEGLRGARAPFLLVGGTADAAWDSGVARELTPYVLEVPGAGHGMYVPGRLAASAAVLGRVATAVEDFLDEVVWR